MALKNSPDSDRTATGFEGQDRAKFGQPRRGEDANRADEASALNNADYLVVELVDGRCSYDGLPEGHCGHFPGEQEILPGPYGTDAEEYDGPAVREDGSRSQAGIAPNPDTDDQASKAQKDQHAAEKDASEKDSGKQ